MVPDIVHTTLSPYIRTRHAKRLFLGREVNPQDAVRMTHFKRAVSLCSTMCVFKQIPSCLGLESVF